MIMYLSGISGYGAGDLVPSGAGVYSHHEGAVSQVDIYPDMALAVARI